jgi:hypothetical protein
MRTVSPASIARPSYGLPANDSPIRLSFVSPPASRSANRTAQPSIAELSCPGTSIGETMSSARIRSSACRMWTRSTVVIGVRN